MECIQILHIPEGARVDYDITGSWRCRCHLLCGGYKQLLAGPRSRRARDITFFGRLDLVPLSGKFQ